MHLYTQKKIQHEDFFFLYHYSWCLLQSLIPCGMYLLFTILLILMLHVLAMTDSGAGSGSEREKEKNCLMNKICLKRHKLTSVGQTTNGENSWILKD